MNPDLLLVRRDLDFMLYEWLDAAGLLGRERYAEHSRETFDAVLDLAEKLAREQFYPRIASQGCWRRPSIMMSAACSCLQSFSGLPVPGSAPLQWAAPCSG